MKGLGRFKPSGPMLVQTLVPARTAAGFMPMVVYKIDSVNKRNRFIGGEVSKAHCVPRRLMEQK